MSDLVWFPKDAIVVTAHLNLPFWAKLVRVENSSTNSSRENIMAQTLIFPCKTFNSDSNLGNPKFKLHYHAMEQKIKVSLYQTLINFYLMSILSIFITFKFKYILIFCLWSTYDLKTQRFSLKFISFFFYWIGYICHFKYFLRAYMIFLVCLSIYDILNILFKSVYDIFNFT